MNRMETADSLLSVAAPFYNEEGVVDNFVSEVMDVLRQLPWQGRYELVLVNDGSTDGTGRQLDAVAQQHPGLIKVLHLSRNFGHAAAVGAALDHVRGDAVILMDADLQDDPAVFRSFIEHWRNGYDVVYAVRTSRQEVLIYRMLFWSFYRVLGWMAQVNLPRDAGNYALMDRKVVDRLCALSERNRYWPGLRAWIGFRQIGVMSSRRLRYDRKPRVGIRGLWKLAMNSIFSFSYVPLLVFRFIGVISIVVSLGIACFALYHKFFTGKTVVAWTSQLVSIAFFGGINLLGIGVIGEYVARIYDEVRKRPMYIVDHIVGTPAQSHSSVETSSC